MTTFTVEMDETKQDTVRLVFKGDPVLIGKMIAHAMDAGPDIQATVISAAMAWCKDNGKKLIFVKNP